VRACCVCCVRISHAQLPCGLGHAVGGSTSRNARRAQAGVRSLELVAPDAGGAALEPAVEASLCACLLTMCPRLDALTLTGCYAADRVIATLPLRRPFALRRLRLRQPAGSGAVHAQLLSDARLASAAPCRRMTGKAHGDRHDAGLGLQAKAALWFLHAWHMHSAGRWLCMPLTLPGTAGCRV